MTAGFSSVIRPSRLTLWVWRKSFDASSLTSFSSVSQRSPSSVATANSSSDTSPSCDQGMCPVAPRSMTKPFTSTSDRFSPFWCTLTSMAKKLAKPSVQEAVVVAFL